MDQCGECAFDVHVVHHKGPKRFVLRLSRIDD